MASEIELIENIGTKIIRCRENCEGVSNNQEKGYYPRSFFLEPKDAPQIKVAVFGKNPGKSSLLERKFYQKIVECSENESPSYEEISEVWRLFSENGEYYLRTKHFLEELGIDTEGILWTEIAFCETQEGQGNIPKKTLEHCKNKFLRKILELISGVDYIICLGNEAYNQLNDFLDEEEENNWKIIRIYHPTGAPKFHNYFEGNGSLKQNIRKETREEFEKIEEKNKDSYTVKINPP